MPAAGSQPSCTAKASCRITAETNGGIEPTKKAIELTVLSIQVPGRLPATTPKKRPIPMPRNAAVPASRRVLKSEYRRVGQTSPLPLIERGH